MPWVKCSSSGSGTAPMPHIPQGQGAGPSSITIRTATPGRRLITRTNFSIFNTSEILFRACHSTHRRLEGVKDEVSAKKTKIILKKGTAVPQYEILPSPLLINHVYPKLSQYIVYHVRYRRRVTSEDNRNLLVLIPLPEMKFNHSPLPVGQTGQSSR